MLLFLSDSTSRILKATKDCPGIIWFELCNLAGCKWATPWRTCPIRTGIDSNERMFRLGCIQPCPQDTNGSIHTGYCLLPLYHLGMCPIVWLICMSRCDIILHAMPSWRNFIKLSLWYRCLSNRFSWHWKPVPFNMFFIVLLTYWRQQIWCFCISKKCL